MEAQTGSDTTSSKPTEQAETVVDRHENDTIVVINI